MKLKMKWKNEKERALGREERRAERELEYAERRKDKDAENKLDL